MIDVFCISLPLILTSGTHDNTCSSPLVALVASPHRHTTIARVGEGILRRGDIHSRSPPVKKSLVLRMSERFTLISEWAPSARSRRKIERKREIRRNDNGLDNPDPHRNLHR